ncbi:30S ribosomal protein S16 [Candidatus Saccharibacteria bacterium]|nr:30S ribosomal protein S16 [Candidatus Saccharibacteria bacterium]
MLVIRMQRTGRKGHAQFRVVVQDSRRTPTSGRLVAALGSFNPHSKVAILDKQKASFYLEHGAQPSERVIRLLKAEGVKLPSWVKVPTTDKQRVVRNADKRRSTRPEEVKDTSAETAAEDNAPIVDETIVEDTASEASEPEVDTEPVTDETAVEAEPETEAPAPDEDTAKEAAPKTKAPAKEAAEKPAK